MSLPTTPPDRSFDVDLFCMQCRYNLRGLTPGGKCPECGKPIAESLRSDVLYLAPLPWLARLDTGCMLIMLSILGPPLFLFGTIAGSSDGRFTLLTFAPLFAGMLLLAAGGWMLTTPEPHHADARAALLRRAIRPSLAIAVVALATQALLAGIPDLLACGVFFAGLVGSLFLMLLRCADLAPRLIVHPLARAARILAGSLIVICLLFAPAIIDGAFHVPSSGAAELASSCVGSLALLLLFPVLLIYFHQFRAHLRGAHRYASYVQKNV